MKKPDKVLMRLIIILLFFSCGNLYQTQKVKADECRSEEVISTATETDAAQYQYSLDRLLKNAMLPIGQTMYIWGGGWNEEDTGAGVEAVSIGVSPRWKEFADKQSGDI